MRKPIALVASLLLCIGAGIWYFRSAPPAPEPAGATSTSVAVVEPPERKQISSSKQASTSSVAATNTDGNVAQPFAVVRAQLEEQAKRGDALAALRLGKAFALCNGFVRRSDSALSNLMVDALASGLRINDGSSGAPLAPDMVMRMARLSSKQQNSDCADVVGLDEKDAPEQAFKWIERAAALGNLDAQAMYGSLAFAMFDSRTALANADVIRDRKALGTAYLQRSLEQGNALALLESSKHYSTGLLFPRDNEAQYAYLYAYSLTSQSEDLLPEIVQLGLDSSAANFDDNTLRRARSQGQQLAECCGAAP